MKDEELNLEVVFIWQVSSLETCFTSLVIVALTTWFFFVFENRLHNLSQWRRQSNLQCLCCLWRSLQIKGNRCTGEIVLGQQTSSSVSSSRKSSHSWQQQKSSVNSKRTKTFRSSSSIDECSENCSPSDSEKWETNVRSHRVFYFHRQRSVDVEGIFSCCLQLFAIQFFYPAKHATSMTSIRSFMCLNCLSRMSFPVITPIKSLW